MMNKSKNNRFSKTSYDFSGLLLILMLQWSCNFFTPSSSQKNSDLFSIISQNPKDTLQYCAGFKDKISDATSENDMTNDWIECIFWGVDATLQRNQKPFSLCEALPPNMQSECHFRIAEHFLEIHACPSDETLQHRCITHIWMQYLQRHHIQNESEGLLLAQQENISMDRSTYNALYHHLLKESFANNDIELSYCQSMIEPQYCKEGAIMLYREMLQTFELHHPNTCQDIQKAPFTTDEQLHFVFSQFQHRVCQNE